MFALIYANKIKGENMRKVIILVLTYILIAVFCISLSGCDYVRNRKYTGKVFNVRVELWEGNEAEVNIWENANNLSYDSEENIYSFYVNGKLIEIDNYESVILTESGAPKPINNKNEKYNEKKFNLTILQGKDVVNEWKNIEIESINSKIICFSYNNTNLTVIPAENHSIIIEEIYIKE
jgi:hypothetical protein